MTTCHRCSHDWEYKGNSKALATCPSCGYKVKLKTEKQNEKDKQETE